jgi:hypothetical protein
LNYYYKEKPGTEGGEKDVVDLVRKTRGKGSLGRPSRLYDYDMEMEP